MRLGAVAHLDLSAVALLAGMGAVSSVFADVVARQQPRSLALLMHCRQNRHDLHSQNRHDLGTDSWAAVTYRLQTSR